MTADEETVLQTYLLRTGAISSPSAFEEWCRVTGRSRKGKSTLSVVLAEAKAYALGCADVLLQKEVMASTYDTICRTMSETLMADRQRRADSLPPMPEIVGSSMTGDDETALRFYLWQLGKIPSHDAGPEFEDWYRSRFEADAGRGMVPTQPVEGGSLRCWICSRLGSGSGDVN